MRRCFVTVDVFTTTPFAGNPLAVMLDADGLSAAQMQAIAREFNYVETTFILPPTDPANTARVRIFTPDRELPFAGHPNIGSVFVLARQGEVFGPAVHDALVFEEGAGLVPLSILRVHGAVLTAPEPFRRGIPMDPALVAAATSLHLDDIATIRHKPVVASVGLPFLIAELQSRSVLGRILPDPPALAELFRLAGVTGLHLYTREVAPDEIAGGHADLSARMVCRVPLVVEDPATGSANCALVALLAQLDPHLDTTVSLNIAQGVDMGRPSLLHASARKQGNIVEAVTVGGSCVEVMQGTLRLAGWA